LSTWTLLTVAPGQDKSPGIKLELGTFSPSDSKHTFRDFHLKPDYLFHTIQDIEDGVNDAANKQHAAGLPNLSDPSHGWVNGQQNEVNLGARQRLSGSLPMRYNVRHCFSRIIPEVEIVISHLIRRQCHRQISPALISEVLRMSRCHCPACTMKHGKMCTRTNSLYPRKVRYVFLGSTQWTFDQYADHIL
jgi:hypothetical protein